MKFEKKIFADTSALPLEEQQIYKKLFPIFKSRVEERSGAEVYEGKASCCGVTVAFALDADMADESYDISDAADTIVIKGKNFNSLMFGLGQLLHKSRYSEEGMQLTEWRGYSRPDCSIRCMYFAIHFYNWYHTTTPEALARYFEDLMLWGYNGACGIFGRLNLNGWDDPNAEKSFALVEKLFSTAKELNLETTTIFANTDFKNRNTAVAADMSGIFCKTGQTVCPSTEEGYQYLYGIFEKIVARLSKIGIDNYIFFPYDEGGCSCEKCKPWGGNGYYRMSKRLFKDIKKYTPNAKAILATWHFNKGINDPRDFEFLDRAIREDKAKGDDWVDYVMLETREGMPPFVKEHGVPGGCEAVDFPEITMQKLEPWGAYGAVCNPIELKRIWNEIGGIMHGGFPYSEGKFDDLNKVIFAGFFWDKKRTAEENFKDYCGYEFREDIFEDLWDMCVLMEKNQFLTHWTSCKPAVMEDAVKARELAVKMDDALPESVKTRWQWRIFYIRALLDYERYAGAAAYDWSGLKTLTIYNRFAFWRQYMLGSRLAQRLQRELIDIYEMPMPYIPKDHFGHQLVRPNYAGITENIESRWETEDKKIKLIFNK